MKDEIKYQRSAMFTWQNVAEKENMLCGTRRERGENAA
jgi:hypothetical protein